MAHKAAIYHFTDESKLRPKIYRDQLDALKSYASAIGFDVADTYCDMSLKRCERSEFDRFLKNCDQYSALITKDFYHISKNTLTAISIMQELCDKGIKIYTDYSVAPEAPVRNFEQQLSDKNSSALR